MYTRKTVGFLALSITILILSYSTGDWPLASLILTVGTLLFLSNLWMTPESKLPIISKTVQPERSFGKNDVTVTLTVKAGDDEVKELEVLDLLPASLELKEGTNHFTISLRPNEAKTVSYTLREPPVGNYRIGPTLAKVADPLGLFTEERTFTETAVTSVYPRPEKIRTQAMRTRHIGAWPGTIPARRAGIGTEFYGIRDYEPGDEPRRISWKASARRARLSSNEYESEKVTDVMIVVDSGRGSELDIGGRPLLQSCLEAAASLSAMLLGQGNRVGLILQGPTRNVVAPAFGKRQLQRILYALADGRPGRAALPTAYVVGLLASLLLPAKAQVIIVSPLLDPDIPVLAEQLAVSGISLLVVAPFQLIVDNTSQTGRIAARILAIERKATISVLKNFGDVLETDPSLPLDAHFRKMRKWISVRA